MTGVQNSSVTLGVLCEASWHITVNFISLLSDGQIKIIDRAVEEMLQAVLDAGQRNWNKCLDVVEFVYNKQSKVLWTLTSLSVQW